MGIAFPTLILKNQTATDIVYALAALTVPASSQVTVPFFSYAAVTLDDYIRRDLRAGTVILNDGVSDLGLTDANDLLDALVPLVPKNFYKNMTGNGTTTVKSGPGVLVGFLIGNDNTGGVATIYDNTAGSGTTIATIQFGSPTGGLLSVTGLQVSQLLPMESAFQTGLTVVLSGSTSNNITAVYR